MNQKKSTDFISANLKQLYNLFWVETCLNLALRNKIKGDAMNIKKWLSKEFFETALAMLRFVVENANPNLVFIGLVILGIFWISLKKKKKKGLVVEDTNPNLVFIGLVILGIFLMGFYWHFCKPLKSKRQKPKKKKKKKGK